LKNKELAGKNAIFDVTILSASKRILPIITDEFANEVRPGLTADGLRDELRKAVDTQDAQEYMGARNEALGRALSECMDVDIPDTLVTNQAREKYALMMTDMRDNGMADEEIKKLISPENFVKYKDIQKDSIIRDFKISMAVDEIARLENIQVPAYQVEEQMQSLKDQAAKDGTNMDDTDDEQLRRKVESTLERRMVYDLLADAADLTVEYINEEGFDEALMERLAAESLAREQQADEGKQDVVTAVTATTVAETPLVEEEKVEDAEPVVELTVVETDTSSVTASTKEEDLELTTQVIMNYINSGSDGDGVVDDDDDE
jgi:trigger factor